MTWRKTTTVAMRRASRAKTSRRTLIWCRRSGRWLEKGCAPAQLALAWLLAQGDGIVPIQGTKKRTRLEENVGALDVRITAEDRARIDAILPRGAAAGTRYAAPQMQALNR